MDDAGAGWMQGPLSRRRVLSNGAQALVGSVGFALVGCGKRAQPGLPMDPQAAIATPSMPASTAPDPGSSTARSTSGQAAATPATSGYAFPLKASLNKRHVVDEAGRPFRIQGDSAWSLIANLTRPEADAYLSDRQARGFNAVLVNLLEHRFAINAPSNRNEDPPFNSPGVFSTPNEAYFAFADEIIDLAASKQIAVWLVYMYLGNGGGGEGWWSELTSSANTDSVCFDYGRYVGNRYKNRDNVVFVAGGDFTPPENSNGEARLHRICEGLRDAGARQIQTGHWDAPNLSTDEPAFAGDMDLNAVYTYGSGNDGLTYVEAQRAFERSPVMPAYLIETGYEAEGWVPGDPASIRKYQYWAALSGGTAGGFYGHRDVWAFATESWSAGYPFGSQPWMRSLDAPGALDFQRLGHLFDSLPWYDLVPSGLVGTKKLIVVGGGTFGKQDYVAAAASLNGSILLAYIPPTASSSRTMTVDLTALTGSVHARWFDPATGSYTEIGTLAATGGKQFTTPGKNGGDATDWVLRLDGTPATSLRPGPRLPQLDSDGMA